jgi:hypothetical protein
VSLVLSLCVFSVAGVPVVAGIPAALRVGNRISLNRPGTVSVIPRKKVLILRHSEFCGRANSEACNGMKWNRIP